MIILLFSCDKEELKIPEISIPRDNVLPKGNDNDLSLTFSMKTEEDQMGAFAENAMTIFEGEVWSVGGINAYGNSTSHYLWNSDNGINWATVATSSVPGNFADYRVAHTLTAFNDQLFIIGGENESGITYENFWISSLDGSTWTESIAPFGNISGHSTLVLDDKMFVIAGNSISENTEVWSTYDGIEWTEENSNAFPGRAGQKGVVFNNIMYVIGGEDIAGNKLNDIWSSSDGVNWSNINTPFTGRNAHTATVYNNKIWVIGGKDSTTLFNNEIWYSEDATNWTLYEGVRPSDEGINSHSILNYNGVLWLFGGSQSDGTGGSQLRGEISTIEE